MKRIGLYFITITVVTALSGLVYADTFDLVSPGGNLKATISVTDRITWTIQSGDLIIISPSVIAMDTSQGTLGVSPETEGQSRNSSAEVVHPVVPEKRKEILDKYNALTLTFKQGYDLQFRAYDDGMAYRFVTRFDGELIVKSERLEFNFAADHAIYFPREDSLITHQEREYFYQPLSKIPAEQFSSIPALVDIANGPKVILSESDLYDYPGFYLQGTASPALKTTFPNYVLEESMRSDRDPVVEKRADFIAKTTGHRSFPWRVVGVAQKDADLINSQIIWKLARPCQIKDTSWIKPGKVAWDWYNANNIFGVDFPAGVNTETYKYYIDFASQHGIEYIILDEGWYQLGDLLKLNPDMDVPGLFKYAQEKNVGIILWVVWKTLDNQLKPALDLFAQWGCKGIKVDFMQRDDQAIVNYYEKIAREAADRKMLVDFHGAYKPAGLRRAYPNVITREGVKGAENNKWCDLVTPDHNLTLPFIRMFAGPMDYTPGAMVNAQKKNFNAVFDRPMSQGTRCHQLGMYVVFESPLQMLCDSPTQYYRDPDCMKFLGPVPSVWDDTVVLDAKVGDFVAIARRNGNDWYIGAMTDWTPREKVLDLAFLNSGKFSALIFQDGVNAARYASDYKMLEQVVSPADKLTIKLAPGGGWVARLTPVQE